jgi:hypothetical protein
VACSREVSKKETVRVNSNVSNFLKSEMQSHTTRHRAFILVFLSLLVGVNEQRAWCEVHRCIHTPEAFKFEVADGVRLPTYAYDGEK